MKGGLRVVIVYRIVTFKVDVEVLEALDRLARRKRVSRSELIREAITRMLIEEGIIVDRKPKQSLTNNDDDVYIEDYGDVVLVVSSRKK
ncbi:MAG TPA: ribbon-helix-helix protein, CopG family [Pyrodictium sp.]|nr:ribbon-helix-helix protein, CopG family [Pyrodictium sp.]